MTPKEFVECGGKITVIWSKIGYNVVASYDNDTLSRRYVGDILYTGTQQVAMQRAVNECLFHRSTHLRVQQNWNISMGLSNELPVDVFSRHPGLNNID